MYNFSRCYEQKYIRRREYVALICKIFYNSCFSLFLLFSVTFSCLLEDKGDVAFLPSPALLSDVDSSKIELLCPNGGRAAINEWQTCNLGLEPPRLIVSSAAKTATALEELTHGILAASGLYSKRPDLLHLFGTWSDRSNILFRVISFPPLFSQKSAIIFLCRTENSVNLNALFRNFFFAYFLPRLVR